MKTNTVLMEGKLTWYAVYTRPRSEKKVQEALVKLHIPNYLPLLRVRKKWSDRYKWVEEPVFSSYVFVNIEYDSQSLAIMRIPHVVNFVITGSTPAVISDTDMDLLRLTVENFAESLIIRDTSGLSTGEKVRINDGPFAGKEAVIKRIQGKTLIVLSFPALNKSIEVEIPVEQIAKI